MPLVSSTLASGLQALTPTSVEATAIAAFSDAWASYFQAASVQGTPPVGGMLNAGLAAAQEAMKSAMVGMSAPNAGSTKIQAGIQAFWDVVAAQAAVIWLPAPNVVTPPAVAPPTLSSIASALESVFSSNTSGNLSLAQAAQNIADVLHTNGGMGGTVTITTPAPATIPGIPIL